MEKKKMVLGLVIRLVCFFFVVAPVFISMIAIFCVDGVVTSATAQVTIKTFPDLKFMEMLKDVDPRNAYAPMFRGMYEDRVDVKGKKRTFKTFIPSSVTQGDNSIYVAVPTGVDTVAFLENSGWTQIAEKYKLYLFAFEPENKNWDTTNTANEIEYIKAVYTRVNVRPYYNIVMGNYYFVWVKMTLVDTKVKVQYQRRRCQHGKDSKSDLHEGASRGSSKAGNRRWPQHTGSGAEVIGFPLDHTVLGQGEQRGQA